MSACQLPSSTLAPFSSISQLNGWLLRWSTPPVRRLSRTGVTSVECSFPPSYRSPVCIPHPQNIYPMRECRVLPPPAGRMRTRHLRAGESWRLILRPRPDIFHRLRAGRVSVSPDRSALVPLYRFRIEQRSDGIRFRFVVCARRPVRQPTELPSYRFDRHGSNSTRVRPTSVASTGRTPSRRWSPPVYKHSAPLDRLADPAGGMRSDG